MDTHRIAFVAALTNEAQAALAELTARYGDTPIDEAQAIVALGGDGFMLRTLHRHIARGLPVYGMKLGTIGFLMNHHHMDDLPQRLADVAFGLTDERAQEHPNVEHERRTASLVAERFGERTLTGPRHTEQQHTPRTH